jgi:hypothetical protein
MVDGPKGRKPEKQGEYAFDVVLEWIQDEEAEERLLRVYELLLGLSNQPGICPEDGELT